MYLAVASRRNRQQEFGAWQRPVSGVEHLRRDAAAVKEGKDPLEVAAVVVEAVENDNLYPITGPEFWPAIRRRFEEISRAMGNASPAPF